MNLLQKVMRTSSPKFYPYSLSFADCQCKKTTHMLKRISEIISQVNIIIFVDNKNDQQQQMYLRLEKYISDGKLPNDTKVILDTIPHKKVLEEFKEIFRNNRKHQILIFKFNHAQLAKLMDGIVLGKDENVRSTVGFQIFVDEGDIVTKHQNTKTVQDGQPRSHHAFIKIRDKYREKNIKCYVEFISATPQNILGNYPIEKIFTYPQPEDYVGFKDIDFVHFPKPKAISEVTQLIQSIRYDIISSGEKGNILVCTDHLKNEHGNMMSALKQLDILTIIYNGDGSTIYIPTALMESFQYHVKMYYGKEIGNYSLETDPQTFQFKKEIFIGDVYQILNNMGVQTAVTIGKDLMGRGISFCSISREDSIPFATTRMILNVANTTNCVYLLQMIGRLLGTVCPYYQRKLYCDRDVYKHYMDTNRDLLENIENRKSLLNNRVINYTDEIQEYGITKRSRKEDRMNAHVKTEIVRGDERVLQKRKRGRDNSLLPSEEITSNPLGIADKEFEKFKKMCQTPSSVLRPIVNYLYTSYRPKKFMSLEQIADACGYDSKDKGELNKLKSNLFRISKSGAAFFLCERANNQFILRENVHNFIKDNNLFV